MLALSGLYLALALAPLSSEERGLPDAVDQTRSDRIRLLEQIVNINSGTENHAGVEQVARVLAPHFERLGFRTRWIPMKETGRAGHLFAERQGSRGKKLLLIGHLDTVFSPDSPFQRFELRGRRAAGPGVADMKGGLIVILGALEALHRENALEDTSLVVALTGDEESVGEPVELARRDLLAAARRSDLALEFEGFVADASGGAVSLARRGASGWTLRSTGKAAHSSGIFSERAGSGALFELARVLHQFHQELREDYLTFNVGLALGGTEVTASDGSGTASGKSNIVPRTAVATGDLRTISREQLERVRGKMKAIVSRHLPLTSSEVTFTDRYPAMEATAQGEQLLREFQAASKDLDLGPIRALDPRQRGAADISFVAPIIPGLAGLGAPGGGAHTAAEEVDLEQLERQIKRVALFIYRLTR